MIDREKLKQHALSDEDLEKVVGGGGGDIEEDVTVNVSCPLCGKKNLKGTFVYAIQSFTDIYCKTPKCSFYYDGFVEENNLQSWRASYN